jgi:hypothetical protein
MVERKSQVGGNHPFLAELKIEVSKMAKKIREKTRGIPDLN